MELFTKKNWKKNQKEFRVEKVRKRKGDKLYVTWKGYDSYINSWIRFIKLCNVAGVDTSDLSKKTDLANLKFEVDKLDIDKLKNVPSGLNSLKNKVDKLDVNKIVPPSVDLSKLIDAVKNVVKKNVCNAKIEDIANQIPEIGSSATNTTFNAKVNEVRNEIPNITNLATTTTALIVVENKILDHSKYITIPKFKKSTVKNFAAILVQPNLASKNNIVKFAENLMIK